MQFSKELFILTILSCLNNLISFKFKQFLNIDYINKTLSILNPDKSIEVRIINPENIFHIQSKFKIFISVKLTPFKFLQSENILYILSVCSVSKCDKSAKIILSKLENKFLHLNIKSVKLN